MHALGRRVRLLEPVRRGHGLREQPVRGGLQLVDAVRDQGACVLDTRPSPDCTTNANCLSTQVCQSGFCLYTCTTAMDCELTDTRIPVCADGVCRSTAEANPACTTQAQCNSAQDCIGNICQ